MLEKEVTGKQHSETLWPNSMLMNISEVLSTFYRVKQH